MKTSTLVILVLAFATLVPVVNCDLAAHVDTALEQGLALLTQWIESIVSDVIRIVYLMISSFTHSGHAPTPMLAEVREPIMLAPIIENNSSIIEFDIGILISKVDPVLALAMSYPAPILEPLQQGKSGYSASALVVLDKQTPVAYSGGLLNSALWFSLTAAAFLSLSLVIKRAHYLNSTEICRTMEEEPIKDNKILEPEVKMKSKAAMEDQRAHAAVPHDVPKTARAKCRRNAPLPTMTVPYAKRDSCCPLSPRKMKALAMAPISPAAPALKQPLIQNSIDTASSLGILGLPLSALTEKQLCEGHIVFDYAPTSPLPSVPAHQPSYASIASSDPVSSHIADPMDGFELLSPTLPLKQMHLFLGTNGTLMDLVCPYTGKVKEIKPEFEVSYQHSSHGHMIGRFRPGLAAFMEFCFENFASVSLWASDSIRRGKEFGQLILPPLRQFKFILGVEDFAPHHSKTNCRVKDFRRWWADPKFVEAGITADNTFIIDDRTLSSENTLENAVVVKSWDMCSSDCEEDACLDTLRKIFEHAQVSDAREMCAHASAQLNTDCAHAETRGRLAQCCSAVSKVFRAAPHIET